MLCSKISIFLFHHPMNFPLCTFIFHALTQSCMESWSSGKTVCQKNHKVMMSLGSDYSLAHVDFAAEASTGSYMGASEEAEVVCWAWPFPYRESLGSTASPRKHEIKGQSSKDTILCCSVFENRFYSPLKTHSEAVFYLSRTVLPSVTYVEANLCLNLEFFLNALLIKVG